jgi:hypothetical protein
LPHGTLLPIKPSLLAEWMAAAALRAAGDQHPARAARALPRRGHEGL